MTDVRPPTLFANGSCPVYFIAQLQNNKVIGVLVNSTQHPRAPLCVTIDSTHFGEERRPVLSQLWRVPNYEGVRGAAERPTLRMVDYLLVPHARARPDGVEIVSDAETS